jgi:hypothetical protein
MIAMDIKQKSLELKQKLIDSLSVWADDRITAFANGNPKLKTISVYLKRGANNIIKKYDNEIGKMIENAMIFIADENGNYNLNILFDDIMSMFKNMEEIPVNLGLMTITIGKGAIRIPIQKNAFTSILLGKDIGAIRITESDFVELKNILTNGL